MLAKLLVRLYLFIHGRLGLPGAGWLIRLFVPRLRQLRDFPLEIPGVGIARLDFSDLSAFGLLNVYLGEVGDLAPLVKWLSRLIQPGDVFWDVGANVGYLDLLVVLRHPQLGAIHAFEPNPRALRPLQSMFKGFRGVAVHPVGLGRVDATLLLNVPDGGSAVGSLVHAAPGSIEVPVQIRNGDTYRMENGIPLPNIIKIDVEGFEVDVLEGLAGTIAEAQPVILFEYTFLKEEQIRSLVPPGYVLYFILDDGSITGDLACRSKGHDGLLLPKKSMHRTAMAGHDLMSGGL